MAHWKPMCIKTCVHKDQHNPQTTPASFIFLHKQSDIKNQLKQQYDKTAGFLLLTEERFHSYRPKIVVVPDLASLLLNAKCLTSEDALLVIR